MQVLQCCKRKIYVDVGLKHMYVLGLIFIHLVNQSVSQPLQSVYRLTIIIISSSSSNSSIIRYFVSAKW